MARRARGRTEETLRAWIVGGYFDYIKDKGRGGGFPNEYELYCESRVKFAPEIAPADLLAELIRAYCAEVWRLDLDPASRSEDATSREYATADDVVTEARPVDGGEGEDTDDDLFSVAGVLMPPSFTFPDPNVPGGYRRVGRRWATHRHMQMDVWVKRKKADEAVAAADRALDDSVRVGGIARDPDELLWTYRDGVRRPSGPAAGDRPRA